MMDWHNWYLIVMTGWYLYAAVVRILDIVTGVVEGRTIIIVAVVIIIIVSDILFRVNKLNNIATDSNQM